MEIGEIICVLGYISLLISLQSETSSGSIQSIGKISPGFEGSQMTFIDRDGSFLLSNNSDFAFGFSKTTDVTLFVLVVVHMGSSQKVIWSANRGSPVTNSDKFVFDEQGNVFLQKRGSVVWTTNTGGKGVSAMELQDNGNLVVLGSDSTVIWQTFDHPTDTLITNQVLKGGIKLVSDPSPNNLSCVLEIKSGDMTLSAAFQNPQPYWSMRKDNRIIINKDGGVVATATIEGISWRFYDSSKVLLWQFVFADNNDANGTWIAYLGRDGFISFHNLQDVGGNGAVPTKIPTDPCGTPEPCGAQYICSSNNKCQCPSALSASGNCSTGIVSPCDGSNNSAQLVNVGDGLNYFALGFLPPSSKTDLDGCKASCSGNCSCLGLFFQNSSGNCFLLDSLGSFSDGGSGFDSYIKVSSNGGGTIDENGSSTKKHFPFVAIIIVGTVLVIAGLLYAAFRYSKWNKRLPESPQETSEEDNFLESLSGMPIRFSYRDLQTATNNFAIKLGQGGFGSVYEGVLPDGTRVAVKKLEGIGQGKKEFRAEVSIIGSIHHHHLVRIKGFCAEGTHRLLAYEYMANGSLDKWIFKKNKGEFMLDWKTRFNIALGTAKGLAYLHEDCDAKIVHCDIKPENVLLDDRFLAKVSDFGLAKLMTREQSHVFTTMRGTRGYLAPEWITNYAISEKSDVYSYGMVLLEIIGGRKNFDPAESSDKSNFPLYAFKMMEEGKLRDIVDIKLNVAAEDEETVSTTMKVALWCIQEDMHSRPSMTKVVQMLEGISPVSRPPMSSPLGSRLFASFINSNSQEGTTSSGPSDYNSDAHLSAVRLSGPR